MKWLFAGIMGLFILMSGCMERPPERGYGSLNYEMNNRFKNYEVKITLSADGTIHYIQTRGTEV
ncbi:MAG: hypothetical protein HY917_04810 [Candidatus Diapherotrites archaeon]|nr:hypothetical protein [Candidatus Diapherotrites archaeon]